MVHVSHWQPWTFLSYFALGKNRISSAQVWGCFGGEDAPSNAQPLGQHDSNICDVVDNGRPSMATAILPRAVKNYPSDKQTQHRWLHFFNRNCIYKAAVQFVYFLYEAFVSLGIYIFSTLFLPLFGGGFLDSRILTSKRQDSWLAWPVMKWKEWIQDPKCSMIGGSKLEKGWSWGNTLPKTNVFAPENKPSQKEMSSSKHCFLGANCQFQGALHPWFSSQRSGPYKDAQLLPAVLGNELVFPPMKVFSVYVFFACIYSCSWCKISCTSWGR